MNICQRLRSVAKLFRLIEFCILLLIFSWLSTRLPFAVRIFGQYFRRFSTFIVSPTSIFLLGNAIVVTLLTKSGLFSDGVSPSVNNAVAELYEEFRSDHSGEIVPLLGGDEVVYQDKKIICEGNTKMEISAVDDVTVKVVEVKASTYLRCKSEKLEVNKKEKLRRSETDICRRDFSKDETYEDFLADDNVNNEEFRRTIEAFIARQVRFHREEHLAVVLPGRA